MSKRAEIAVGTEERKEEVLSRGDGLKKKFFAIVLCFFCISFLGWAAETLFFRLAVGGTHDRGFLSLPFCPIYGFVSALIYLIFKTPFDGFTGNIYRKLKEKKGGKFIGAVLTVLAYFFLVTLFATAFEFLTGLLYDKVFGIKLWDYSYFPNNLMGYVTPVFSLLWGCLITMFMGLLYRPAVYAAMKIPAKVLTEICVALICIMTADFLLSAFMVFR